MGFQRWQLFVLLLGFINLHVYYVFVEAQDDLGDDCSVDGNYTANSVYEMNLEFLLSTLPSNMGTFGFYNSSIGVAPAQVSIAAICRADVQSEECRSCIINATTEIRQRCPMRMDAILYKTSCTIRYTNKSIFGIYDTRDGWTFWQVDNVTSLQQFNDDLSRLLIDLRNQAVNLGPLIKVATDNVSGPNFLMIYSLVQCTPDISADDCRNCLERAAVKIVSGSTRVRVYMPNCMMSYATSTIYNTTRIQEVVAMANPPAPAPLSPPPPPALPPSTDQSGHSRTIIIIIVVVAIVPCAIAVVGLVIIFKRRKMKKEKEESTTRDDDGLRVPESIQYSFDEIKEATHNFSETNKLGEGGFGAVYKGTLENGKEIAAKKLLRGSAQGDKEFKNEAILVGKLQHRNLVRLYGFAIHSTVRLLVYEFVENGSLDRFIFDPVKRSGINWDTRCKIIIGIAKGLVYLHEDSRLRIIHRDLKAGNILLDGNMEPKIADFGLARLVMFDRSEGRDASKIVGTRGYMAPEYLFHGQISTKIDVFSFGIIILEIVSGQRNSSDTGTETLLSSMWRKWRQGEAKTMVDPLLRASSRVLEDIVKCIHIGLLCTQENPSNRPTMASVVQMLRSSSITLPVLSSPAFSASTLERLTMKTP